MTRTTFARIALFAALTALSACGVPFVPMV